MHYLEKKIKKLACMPCYLILILMLDVKITVSNFVMQLERRNYLIMSICRLRNFIPDGPLPH